MTAYYNECDSKKAAWLRELIDMGMIAPGDVDERSIWDVRPDDLVQYTQCHFFAGVAAWSYALRLAGWEDSRGCWTGSAPCQSFSAAGKGAGFADERHLWPAWHHLIRVCRPDTIFGEQVGAAIGHGWLDLVSDDLESEGYAVGSSVLPACSVGAPHIRQRLWFVAHAQRRPSERRGQQLGAEAGAVQGAAWEQRIWDDAGDGDSTDFWTPCEWLPCRDGKARPTQPGVAPLVDGPARGVGHRRDPLNTAEARVLRLRGYGDAIVAPLAAEFIAAVEAALKEHNNEQ